MTREEAISILTAPTVSDVDAVRQAVEVAVEALSAQPEKRTEERTETHECDCISRQGAIDEIARWTGYLDDDMVGRIQFGLKRLPSAESELYGYKIEHLALIARVMQKEGVTPEKAVQTFVDMKRIIEMLIDEIQEKVEKARMEVDHDSR